MAGATSIGGGGLNLDISWEAHVKMAIDKEQKRLTAKLASEIRRNWQGVSRHVMVTVSDYGIDGLAIHIGNNRYSRTLSHLIEFGGARHAPKSPTRRAIAAQGFHVKWQEG